MAIRELERDRAKFAYEKVIEVVGQLNDKSRKEYKAYCKKIPSFIQTNGLSATFAFMSSKGGTYKTIYKQVDEWLKERYKDDATISSSNELIKRLILLDSTKYRKATIETLAFFSWLRRFAEGQISKDR